MPIFVFNCGQRNNKKIRCLVNGFANLERITLLATLVRSKKAIEALDRIAEEVLAVCQPAS